MRIVLIHYHLKPGGVTTVLRQQAEAISGFGDVLVLSGEKPGDDFPAKWKVVPEIGYDTVRPGSDSPRQLAEMVIDAISTHWPEGCDLIHIHNPTLAKNTKLLKIIAELLKKKIPLFLQIHDFAEDGRPGSYFTEDYPDNCHYGVINGRDYKKLLDSGWNASGLHLIPNAVTLQDQEASESTPGECVLYPVRAIRRKNIGEAILLALFLPRQLSLRITLPPNSPADLASYRYWQSFSRLHKLGIEFEAGQHYNFSDLYQSARYILTTSITEGFGFGFLEPWLRGKPVWGRYLNDICTEFEQQGIRLSHLYHSLTIPLAWIGEDPFAEAWLETVRSVYKAYRVRPDEGVLQHILAQHKVRGTVDFGALSESMQKLILNRLMADKNDRRTFLKLNPDFKNPGAISQVKDLVAHNALVVRNKYGPVHNRSILKAIYQKVIGHPVTHTIDKYKLLAGFLNPYDFNLLKWGKFES
jgi:hypothetical protein